MPTLGECRDSRLTRRLVALRGPRPHPWRIRVHLHDAADHLAAEEEARALWGAIAERFAACKLVLHPQRTKIVYCKDVNRRGDFSNIHFDFLGFQFRAERSCG